MVVVEEEVVPVVVVAAVEVLGACGIGNVAGRAYEEVSTNGSYGDDDKRLT